MKFKALDCPANRLYKSFEEMNLPPALVGILLKKEILIPTDVQSQAIPVILAGNDVVAVAQTGTGKTLAFVLTTLILLKKKKAARALVLAPSREMAQQIFQVFNDFQLQFEIDSCLVIGGIPTALQISQLKKNPRIIIATPGRLNDHLINNKLLLKNVEIIVIDEADRLIDLGFAPQLKNIQKTMRGEKQTLLFTASFKPELEKIAESYMKKEIILIRTVNSETPVDTLAQTILFIERKYKDQALIQKISEVSGAVIIFTGSQDSCERVNDFLNSRGCNSELIHGGLNQGHRRRIIRELREDLKKIVVTTDLLARGLDVPHVTCIINYDLPFLPEDFIHRIGRTARAGKAGEAITFITPSDSKMYEQIKPYLVGATKIEDAINLRTQPEDVKEIANLRASAKVRKDKYKKKE